MPCPFGETLEEVATVQAMFRAGGDPAMPTRSIVPPQSRVPPAIAIPSPFLATPDRTLTVLPVALDPA